ncbi:hypothetical protein WMY93_000793 [Mugilogobius chulae]|uniref:Uncharacterized protein n=1 Tax=Mugilogobius chulae TaxID=88201 RepID=A0AAW0QAE1_9GOBI
MLALPSSSTSHSQSAAWLWLHFQSRTAPVFPTRRPSGRPTLRNSHTRTATLQVAHSALAGRDGGLREHFGVLFVITELSHGSEDEDGDANTVCWRITDNNTEMKTGVEDVGRLWELKSERVCFYL